MYLSEGLSEYKLAKLLSEGFTCSQIATMTAVSLRTVYNWRSRLIKQAGARTITEAVCKELKRADECRREFIEFENQAIGPTGERITYQGLRWGVWGDGEIGVSEASGN